MRGQKVQAFEDCDLFRRQRLEQQTGGFAVLKQLDDLFHDGKNGQRFLVLAGSALAGLLQTALDAFEVGEHEFRFDRVGIADRVDAAFDMGDVGIFEAAEHMDDGIDFADIGEELVAEAFALRGTAHEAGDVDEGDARRDDFLRLAGLCQQLHAWIGNRHFTGVRLDRAERIVRRLRRRRARQCIEESGLAHIGKPDDAAFEAHDISPVAGREMIALPMRDRPPRVKR